MTVRMTQLAAVAVLAGTVAATSAQAQVGTQDTRWRAWIGCWEPVNQDGGPADDKGMRVCVLPSAGNSAVDIVNVVHGAVAERTHVEASGERRGIGREGCTGVETAAWSPDNRRVYLKAEITCDGVRRTTNGLLAFSPAGEWLDVQGVTTGQTTGVHVTRYRPVVSLAGIPAEVTQALSNMQLAVSTARAVASAPLTTDDVVDATKHLDKPVIEAWLLERGQGFDLDAKKLVSLADAGVPGAVTDLMVALSNPKVFAIDRASRQAEMLTRTQAQGTNVTGRTLPVYAYSPFGWGPYGSYSSWYYGNRYGYAYGPYGYGYGNGWYYGNQPIIIINRGDVGNGNSPGSGVSTRPRMVNGAGYTEGRSSPSTSSGSNSGGSSSGSSSSGSGSGSSSSGSSSSGGSGRTAVPRSP